MKLREIESPLDRIDKSIHKITVEKGKVTVYKYNWLQRLIKKLFRI